MGEFFKTFLISPGYVIFIILMIPFAVLAGIVYFKSRRAAQLWFNRDTIRFFQPEIKAAFRIGALTMIFIAMLGPYWGRTEQEIPIRGREVYFLIDVSASMNCEDLQPSRLVKVKREVKKMISEMTGDRVGLIVFTTDAYVQCPLTSDLNAAMLFLDLIGTAQFSNNGTSFKEALLTGVNRFIDAEDSTETKKKLSRSLVLISDGEDFGDSYSSVIDKMQNHDIALFTVGVGTYAGAQVPEMRYGKKVGVKKTQDGQPAISQLKDETLQSLASQFGTTYLPMNDQFDNLDPILDQIKMLSSQELDREKRLSEVNRYQWFLGLGVILFVLTMFWMPIRPPQQKQSENN